MNVPAVDVTEAARRQAAGVPVIDVREPDEYVAGHVPGAVLVPLATLPDKVHEVPAEGELLIICKVGGRSHKAAEYLRAQGIDAINIAGGTLAWIEADLPVVEGPEVGGPA